MTEFEKIVLAFLQHQSILLDGIASSNNVSHRWLEGKQSDLKSTIQSVACGETLSFLGMQELVKEVV